MADGEECERQLTFIDGERVNRPEHHEGLYKAYTIHGISTCHEPNTNDNYTNLLPSDDMCYKGYEDHPPLDVVVVDNIDRELRGLPNHTYICKLLELTPSAEKAVVFYREEMSRRARLQPNSSSDVIKTRNGLQQLILMTHTGNSRRRPHWSYAIMTETYWL